jgi:hypothetical protein
MYRTSVNAGQATQCGQQPPLQGQSESSHATTQEFAVCLLVPPLFSAQDPKDNTGWLLGIHVQGYRPRLTRRNFKGNLVCPAQSQAPRRRY